MNIWVKLFWYVLVLAGIVVILTILPSVVLWILLGLGVGTIVFAYVMIIREGDEEKNRRRGRSQEKSLQTTDAWADLIDARERYNRDIEAWMSPEELRQRRGF